MKEKRYDDVVLMDLRGTPASIEFNIRMELKLLGFDLNKEILTYRDELNDQVVYRQRED